MLLLGCVVAFLVCFSAVPGVIGLSWCIHAVDVPRDARRMHRRSIPRGGGIAIWGSFFLACLAFAPKSHFLFVALGAGFLIFLVGLADDILSLGPWSKLFFEVAVTLAAVLGIGVEPGAGLIAAVLWVTALTNAHNFIDGLDGLLAGTAAVEGGMLALAYFLLGARDAMAAPLFLSAACLAFLVYNRAPACIFAGDCGSGTVGFLFGLLSLPLFGSFSPQISSLSPLFLFAYPLTDLFTAVLRRLLRGKSPFAADRGHLHHRIVAVGLSHGQCCRVLLLLSLSLGGVGVLLGASHNLLYAALAALLTALLLLGLRRYVLSFA